MLLEVTPEMAVAREETFGPVLPLLRAGSAEEALAMANAGPLGLSGSVWSGDAALLRKALGEYRSTLNELYAKLHEVVPEVPDFQIPEPESRKAKADTLSVSLRRGAFALALERLAAAIEARGLFP